MKVAFVIDPIQTFNIYKDSTYMMLKEGKLRGWDQYVLEPKDLFIEDSVAYGNARKFNFNSKKNNWYLLDNLKTIDLSQCETIFIRKNPPFDIDYLYSTYVLSLAQRHGALIINDPESLRNMNEKISIIKYSHLIPKTLLTKSIKKLNEFLEKYQDIIVKPLDGMGGKSVFRIQFNDYNKNVILETITQDQERFIMAQQYQNEIEFGDNRILIINGTPLEYLASRVPPKGDFRGNTLRGAKTTVRTLNQREYEIASTVAKDLKNNGILFAGIDIIGTVLTEINITSPTMIQEIYNVSGINAASILMDSITDILKLDNKYN